MPTNHERLRKNYRQWLENQWRPIAGRETPPNPDPNADPPAGDPPAGDPAGDPPVGDPVNDIGAEYAKLNSEFSAEKAKREAAEAAAQRLRTELRQVRDEAASGRGDWEAVAKERESQLAEATERETAAVQRAAMAENNLVSFQQSMRVQTLATRLGFRDPADAAALLKPEDLSDDTTTERALRALAETKSYLVNVPSKTGLPTTGSRPGGGLTWDQVNAMPAEEINARWDEVQPVLARGKPAGG